MTLLQSFNGAETLSDECDCQERSRRIRNPGEHGVSEGAVHPRVWKADAELQINASAEISWLQTRGRCVCILDRHSLELRGWKTIPEAGKPFLRLETIPKAGKPSLRWENHP